MIKLKLRQFRFWLAGVVGGPDYPWIAPVLDWKDGSTESFGMINTESRPRKEHYNWDYVRLYTRREVREKK